VEEIQPAGAQSEVPQPEDRSADVGKQTTDLAGSIIASVVSSIQTSTAPPQGNIFYEIIADEPIFRFYNYLY